VIESELLRVAIEQIDAANAEDPAGRALPYAQRMTRWLGLLTPEPSAALMIAVRAQHLQRWRTPRSSYPEGRSGYLRWRRACAHLHAEETSKILAGLDAPEGMIDRVAALIRKEGLGQDEETQILEDAACLSFIELELANFAQGREQAMMERVLSRTWAKMSADAQNLAIGLDLSPSLSDLIARVTAKPSQ